MRQSIALRRSIAAVGVGFSGRRARPGIARWALVGAAGCVVALGACNPIPVPDTALLEPQAAPKCDAKSLAKSGRDAGAAADGSDAARLDYERQCYRHAELIARNRLQKLQAQVQRTVQAVKSKESEGATPSGAAPAGPQ